MAKHEQIQKKASSSFTSSPKSSEFLETRPFAPQVKSPANLQTKSDRASRFGHSFANLAVSSPTTPVIQPKLTIGQPGDKYEQEADRVAADVVQRINQPRAVSPKQQGTVQRQEVPEEEELQMKSLVQRREAVEGGEVSVAQKKEQPTLQRTFIGDNKLDFEKNVVPQFKKNCIKNKKSSELAQTLQRLDLVRSLVKEVNKKYLQHSKSDGTDRNSRQELVSKLLDLQQAITHWRHLDVPKEAKNLFQLIRLMNGKIREVLKILCDEDYSHKTLGGTRTVTMATGAPLVATYLPAFRGIARRVIASNTRAYEGSAYSGLRTKKRQSEPVAEGFRPVGFPAKSPYGAKRDANQLEINEEGVCHEFAAAAFAVLQGKNIRVEVCGMKFKTGGHNLVVVGRDPMSKIGNYKTWGQGVVVVDIWKAVIDQQNWTDEGKISWTPEDHFKAFKGTPLNEVSVVYDPTK